MSVEYPSRWRPGNLVLQGIVGGIIGAVLMGMLSMILFPLLGIGGFFQPMNLIGAVFNQSWEMVSGFALGPSVVGIIVHMMMSMIVGVIGSYLSRALHLDYPLIWAVVYALIIWAIAELVILPLVDPILARLFPAWLFALAHIMYGIGLGGYLLSIRTRGPFGRPLP